MSVASILSRSGAMDARARRSPSGVAPEGLFLVCRLTNAADSDFSRSGDRGSCGQPKQPEMAKENAKPDAGAGGEARGGRAGKSAFCGAAGGRGAQNPCKTGLSWGLSPNLPMAFLASLLTR